MSAFLVVAAGATAGCGGDGTSGDPNPIVTSDAGEPGEPDAPSSQPDAAPPVGSCDGVSLEVGTGNLRYTAVDPGDTVYLFRGTQNGYMLYLSVRATGIDPADATLCYRDILTATGANVGEGCWRIQLPNDLGGGVYERVGVWGQIDAQYWSCPECVRGKDVDVEVTLSDTKGCSVSGGWSADISPDAPM